MHDVIKRETIKSFFCVCVSLFMVRSEVVFEAGFVDVIWIQDMKKEKRLRDVDIRKMVSTINIAVFGTALTLNPTLNLNIITTTTILVASRII